MTGQIGPQNDPKMGQKGGQKGGPGLGALFEGSKYPYFGPILGSSWEPLI